MCGAHFALSIRSRNALPERPADKSCHRFHGGIFWAVHLRSGGGAFENLAPGICSRSICEIQNHVCKPGAAGAQEFAKRIAGALRCAGSREAKDVRCANCDQQSADERQAAVGTEPETLQFFYDLGIPVANGYGLTEAGTAITVNDLKPFRADTVGKPLPGMEVRVLHPDADGIGEVAVRSKTVMSGYLNEPELTAETIVNGWLMTADLGRFDSTGHLQLFGRKKNMIVTEEGKNIYPEDVEAAFEGLPIKEFCIFPANYVWPRRTMVGEQLLLVLHLEQGQTLTDELRRDISARNNRLLNYKRVHGLVLFTEDFPRTASLKIKRNILAERLAQQDRAAAILPL